jgi:small GTP-binding protein
MTLADAQKFKVILLGDTGVGKTSIALRRVDDQFEIKRMPTIGTSHLHCPATVDGEQVELLIWDTAGQEQFAQLVPMYCRGASVCIIVASIVNSDSCDNIPVWRDRLYESGDKPPIIIAINKMDLLEGAPMTMEEIREQLEGFEFLYFVSAKSGDCIEQLFYEAARLAMSRKAPASVPGVTLAETQKGEEKVEQGGCC